MPQNKRKLKSKRCKLLDSEYLRKSFATYFVLGVCFFTLCAADDQRKDNVDILNKQPTTVNAFVYAKSISFTTLENTNAKSDNGKIEDHTSGDGETSPLNLGFMHAFIASISVILVSEIGDKTFFIAAIMAMRHARLLVFIGAISALGLMTILSAVFGLAATVIPRIYTFYISATLFAIFGCKMLYEAYHMSPTDAQDELEEVQSDLKKREGKIKRQSNKSEDLQCDKINNDATTGALLPKPNNDGIIHRNRKSYIGSEEEQTALDVERYTVTSSPDDDVATNSQKLQQSTSLIKDTSANLTVHGDINHSAAVSEPSSGIQIEMNRFNKENSAENQTIESVAGSARSVHQPKKLFFSSAVRVFMQAFTMTFLAEWGDRSQLTTIILSASENVYGVIVGGVLGHSLCTGLAVIGGRMLAQKISVRAVTVVGGIVFLLFSVSALLIGPGKD